MMNFVKNCWTVIGGVWMVDKAVKFCFKLGQMDAALTYAKNANKIYKDLTVEKKESE